MPQTQLTLVYFDIYSLKVLIEINFLLNLVWGLLFKCSFGIAMGFRDTQHNVIAVKGDVQVTQPYTYPIAGVHFDQYDLRKYHVTK